MEATTEPYVCPVCGDRSAFESSCMRCDEPMLDARLVAPWQHSQIEIWQWKHWSVHAISALLVAGIPLMYFALIVALVASASAFGDGAIVFGMLAFLASVFSYIRFVGWLDRNREALVGRAVMRAIPAARVADVADRSRVRVAGATKTIRRAISGSAPPSLAVEQRRVVRSGETSFARQRVSGGEFVLDDGSGVIAIVRCEFLKIVGGVQVGDELIVPEGSRLEVVGNARWDVADEELSVVHARSAARIVRIEGTADEPVLLRIVAATTSAGDGASAQSQAKSVAEPEATVGPTRVRVDASDPQSAPESSTADEIEAQNRAHERQDTDARRSR